MSGVNVYSLLFTFEPILSAMDVEYTKGLSDYSVKATDKPAADALNKMLEWADKGYFGDNWLGVADNNAQTLAFTSGEAVMDIAGSWEAATISENNPDLNYGAFEIPSEEGIRGMVGTPANGFSVNTATENEAAAVAFMNYCASLDARLSGSSLRGQCLPVTRLRLPLKLPKKSQRVAQAIFIQAGSLFL